MIKLDTLSSQVLLTTTRIMAHKDSGKSSVGTAFYFHFKVNEQTSIPALVTNRHVIENAKTGEFYVHTATTDPTGKRIPTELSVPVALPNFSDLWIAHPGGIDLCAMPFEPLRQTAQQMKIDIFYIHYDEQLIPSAETLGNLAAMEDITMVGYPIGLWDQKNNFPLLRKGVTASHPASDFNGEPIGLLDIAALPGSSGSPILVLNQGSYAVSTGISIGSRLILLGILYMYYRLLPGGETKAIEIPTTISTDEMGIPLHIGRYIKSSELLELKKALLKLVK